MTQITTIRCDFCDRVKEATNHWFTLIVFRFQDGGLSLHIESHDQKVQVLPGDTVAKDACGHQCVCQGVARFMDHGTLDAA